MTAATPVSPRLVALHDLDVAALVSDRAARRGRTIYNNGGVAAGRASGDRLTARVRDRAARSFQVTVTLSESGLSSTCTCYQEGVCEHAAAALFAWTDNRSSFAFVPPDSAEGVVFPETRSDALWHGLRTESGSLTALLLGQRITDLRKLAQRMGSPNDSAPKETLARQIAAQLVQPPQLATTLAQLAPAQRMALDVVLLFDNGLAPADLERAARVLDRPLDAGGAEGTLKALMGLAFTSTPSAPTAAHWQAPLEVAATIAPAALPLAEPTASPSTPERGDLALSAYVRGLAMVLGAQAVEARPSRVRPPFEAHNAVLGNWHNVPDEIDALQRQGFSAVYNPSTLLTMAAPPCPVSDATLVEMADALGCSIAEVAFLLRLLDQLHLLDRGRDTITLAPGVAQLAQLPALEQARLLAATWAADTSWSELHQVEHVRLRRNLQGTLYLHAEQIYNELAGARRYVVRLVRALVPGHWWSFASLSERAYRLHPRFLVEQRARASSGVWQLTDTHNSPIDLARPSDWQLVAEPFMREVVRALAWLGIVATDPALQSFSVTSLGAYLLGWSGAYSPETSERVLTVDADLRVALDAAAADGAVLGTMEQLGEVDGFAAGRFRYRITPRSLRDALTHGQTLQTIQDFLARYSQSPLPEATRDTLEQWAAGFGQTHLYSGLALLELADELLLPELLRSTSLRGALLEQLSPRLLLLDPAQSDALWAELVAKGYTPQRVRSVT